MKRTRRLLVAATAVAMLAVLPHAAIAQETDRDPTATTDTQVRDHPYTIDEIRARALAAIDKRLTALERVGTKVGSDSHVTPEHASALIGHYERATEGLKDLAGMIRAAETRERLRELVPLIAEDFRVYLVILPKSHEVLVSDRMADAVERMSGVATTLLEAIERAEEAGHDMTEARRWLTEANDKIGAVERGAVPVANSVIGLTAADWEEPAKTLLAEGKRMLETARGDVRDAIEALKNTRRAIAAAID